jgi:uncharacterized protein (TIGR00369 family)
MASLEQVRSFLASQFPQATIVVEEVGERRARVKQAIGTEHLRPGGTVSGPSLMAVADAATYAAILATIGLVPLAVTTNLSIAFLRRPSADRAIVGDARLLKVGKSLVFAECSLFSDGEAEPVAHATLTYAIPPPDQK